MIDKIDVRVPSNTRFSRAFELLYRDLSQDPNVNAFRSSQHYIRVGDLRPFGYQALLHVHCLRDKQGNHKVELVDAGQMSFAEMRAEIERIFDIDSKFLGLMRIDLAADVPGVPVTWFAKHARGKWKQWACDIGQIEYAAMGRRTVQSFYLGRRPNCFRIYDKIAEYQYQYGRMLRGRSETDHILGFEDVYGYPERGFILTRVERQIGGSRVPERINSIWKLRRLADFNPFDKLELTRADTAVEPQMCDYKPMQWLAGMGLRAQANEMGIHRLRAMLNAQSRGNASRIFRKYQAFLPNDAGIDESRLYGLFQESVSRQLVA